MSTGEIVVNGVLGSVERHFNIDNSSFLIGWIDEDDKSEENDESVRLVIDSVFSGIIHLGVRYQFIYNKHDDLITDGELIAINFIK